VNAVTFIETCGEYDALEVVGGQSDHDGYETAI
jgi:hypothetical protein